MTKLPEKYDAKVREKFWQNYWREKKIYQWRDDLPKEQTFVIDTPPPTVSGLLHMGHVFSYTQADFVARFMRTQGKDVFYPMGFDDNGLPTERLVEKIIGKKAGIYESENGRGSFVNKCREVVEEAEKEFEILFNEIALSVDWDQKYQTISPKSQRISQASFLDLYAKGLVERKSEPIVWDVSDRTALAQADLVDKEVDGMMNEINFLIDGENKPLVIMTTRPELLSACVAVMINPEDERFSHLIKQSLNQEGEGETGSFAITALFGVRVPIIADKLVQTDKGTGAVMCCTFGDETDIKWWRKHKLSLRTIITKDGKIEGLSIKQAREKIVEELKVKNFLLNQTPTKQIKPVAERSGVPIEYVESVQWFVKILDKKEQLKAKAFECNWYPNYMRLRVEQWIDGLSWDWCISRQRFFGVNFPVWYSKRKGEEGKILVAEIDQLPVDPSVDLPRGYLRNEVESETDIMDTWATSSISPQLSSEGISKDFCFDEARHKKLFPADMRPQAHEIIRTWAFYTIVKSMLHEDKTPWKNLMISGWCLAADKTKMSKSKGNVVTPTALIEEKTSDVVRYWASASNLGADIAYSEEVFKIGQKLITKLFNAAKFCSQHFEILPKNFDQNNSEIITEVADLWILGRLQKTIETHKNQFEIFEYARAREAVEEFFWKDFCDNYLEICKVRSYGILAEKLVGVDLTDEQKQEISRQQVSAIATLHVCLNNLLKLFAPFIPHISEEIYSTIFAEEFKLKTSIHGRGNSAKLIKNFFDQKNHLVGEAALLVIFEVRKWKSEQNLSMKTTIKKLCINYVQVFKAINQNANSDLKAEITKSDFVLIIKDLANVCNAEEIELVNEEASQKIIEIAKES